MGVSSPFYPLTFRPVTKQGPPNAHLTLTLPLLRGFSVFCYMCRCLLCLLLSFICSTFPHLNALFPFSIIPTFTQRATVYNKRCLSSLNLVGKKIEVQWKYKKEIKSIGFISKKKNMTFNKTIKDSENLF